MEKYLNCVMDIGEKMLISGAEVHRIEQSICHMCKAFGASRTDVFIITSSMVVTVFDEVGKTYTQTRRITASGTDFEKLHKLNALSRKICSQHLSVEDIKAELEKIEACRARPFWLESLSYSVIAGAFTLFYGGSITEAMVSFVIGAIVRLSVAVGEKAIRNRVFSKFFSSVVATLLAYIALKIGVIESVDKVIIGNIMTLIPGVGLTNALRDLFTGDSIAAILRTIEAVLIALAIAAGYFLVALLGGF